MLIAQISDLHVRPRGKLANGNVDSNAMLGAAIDRILALTTPPDCVIATGDLTDCGLAEEYALLDQALRRLPMPVFVLPGNHDRCDEFVRGLGGRHRYLPRDGGRLHFTIDDFPVRIVALDSVVAGETHGELGADDIAWLERALTRGAGRPTLLCLHHPPFPTGIASMDAIGCRDHGALASLIARHPEIERVLCGHHHRPITTRWAGTIGFVAPSTAHQVAFELRDGLATQFIFEPPAIALHAWSAASGVATHLLPIGDFGRPFAVNVAADYPGRAP